MLAEELPASAILSSDAGEAQHAPSSELPPSATAFSPFYPSPLYMFLLTAPPAVLLQRISARKGHYFPASLLQSQLDDLQWPGEDEDVMAVDVSMPKQQVVEILVNAIVRRHRGGEVGEHVSSFIDHSSAAEATKEPVLLNPFQSAL